MRKLLLQLSSKLAAASLEECVAMESLLCTCVKVFQKTCRGGTPHWADKAVCTFGVTRLSSAGQEKRKVGQSGKTLMLETGSVGQEGIELVTGCVV